MKVVTGDNAAVAGRVCGDLGLPTAASSPAPTWTPLDDARLARRVATTTIFARVSPEHKARIVRAQRRSGGGVAFLGDGVNDALALHAADVGISVDSATDVAKDAADVSCWRRISTCSPTVSPKAGASSRTPSSTC